MPKVRYVVQRHGVPCVVKRQTGAYTPETGQRAAGTRTYRVKCTPPAPAAEYLVRAGVLTVGDTTIIFDGDFRPKNTDEVTVNSVTYTITHVYVYMSGTLACAYEAKLEQ